ncbi:MAG: metallophosphoesterase family protein [Anaerolineae bacterium]|nr:metallophosphoesterase family protein [Anaerolineae bacterium]
MRIAVLSDLHGNLDALDAALADLEARGGADKVWVLGDLAAFCPNPAETLARVRAIPNVEVIYGNTDRYIYSGRRPALPALDEAGWANVRASLEARDGLFAWVAGQLDYDAYEYLRKLPPELATEVEGFGWVVAFHAAPGDDEQNLYPDTPDDEVADALLDRQGRLALCGHTHLPMRRDVGNGWQIINPGSVGLPFDGDRRAAYCLLEFGKALEVTPVRVEYDVDGVIGKLRASSAPNAGWVIKILETARPPGWKP